MRIPISEVEALTMYARAGGALLPGAVLKVRHMHKFGMMAPVIKNRSLSFKIQHLSQTFHLCSDAIIKSIAFIWLIVVSDHSSKMCLSSMPIRIKDLT